MWSERLGGRCLVVAEVAQTHDGSLGTALSYIDAAAAAGADAIKFQTHIAAAESTPGEPWRVRFSLQDETRFDYWRRMEFTEAQWRYLARRAAEKQIIFLSSAFSTEAVDLLERIGVAAWKVGAGEITNLPLLRRMAATGKPVILSSGMSTWEELDAAVEVVRAAGNPLCVLQCTSEYPCASNRIGFNILAELQDRYGCRVGLSDHSGTIYAGLGAAALGASLVEVHIAFSRECFGPDVTASITTAELKQLVEGVRFISDALAHPVDKQDSAVRLTELRRIFSKSIVAVRDLPAGTRVAETDVTFKKPGTGLPPARICDVVGRVLARDIAADAMLFPEDFRSPQAL